MIAYQEALDIIAQHAGSPGQERLALEACLNRVLAQEVVADRDFPPFDRVTMDGIAIRHSENGPTSWTIAGVAPAGSPQATLDSATDCVEIMTGAMLPQGADTIIRYEDLEIADGVATLLEGVILKPGQNIHRQGSDRQTGEVLLAKGNKLGAAELGIAASVGCTHLHVLEVPTAAIISTGDELVPVGQTPEPYQIRRSNVYSIQGSLQRWGIQGYLYHLPDDPETMRRQLSEILTKHTLIILTGGVSMGKFDFLPQVMDDLGVQKHFHKVRQRPGKPLWFGTLPNGPVVFALPGNPVSSFMCTQVYVQHWWQARQGINPAPTYAALVGPMTFKPSLTYFLPCALQYSPQGVLEAMPYGGQGSGDFANLSRTDAFMILPPDKDQFEPGEVYPVVRFRDPA